jgi:hypothetical protein
MATANLQCGSLVLATIDESPSLRRTGSWRGWANLGALRGLNLIYPSAASPMHGKEHAPLSSFVPGLGVSGFGASFTSVVMNSESEQMMTRLDRLLWNNINVNPRGEHSHSGLIGDRAAFSHT